MCRTRILFVIVAGRLIAVFEEAPPSIVKGILIGDRTTFIRSPRLPGPCSVYQILFQERTSRINERNLRYKVIRQNSNAYAYTLLLVFGLVRDYFTDDAIARTIGGTNRIPGWGQNLLP